MDRNRLAAIRTLHRMLADDAYYNARRAVTNGWPDDPETLCALLDDYREWVTGIIDNAVDEAQVHLWWAAK